MRQPIHDMFDLSYSAYAVLDPAATLDLPPSWHLGMTLAVDQLRRAYAYRPQANQVIALAGELHAIGELDEQQMIRWEVVYDPSEETGFPDEPYSYRGESYEGDEWMVFPLETLAQARAGGRIVLNRTLLQSMPADWQERFVQLFAQMHNEREYAVRCYDADGREIDDPIPHYSRGRTYLEPKLEARA